MRRLLGTGVSAGFIFDSSVSQVCSVGKLHIFVLLERIRLVTHQKVNNYHDYFPLMLRQSHAVSYHQFP